jgi:hypothetical protein
MSETELSLSQEMNAAINDAMDTTFAAETTTTPDPEPPAVEATASPEVTPETVAATPVALTDDTLVELVVNGQPLKIPYGEAKKGFMMHQAFTQKTQELARQRQEAQTWRENAQREIQEAQQLREQIMSMVKDPNKLSALYLASQGQQAPAPVAQPAPLDPVQLRQQLLQELAPQVQQYVTQQTQMQQQAAALEADVTSFTNTLIESNPVLKVFGPDYANIVYEKVARLQPSNPAEAKEYIRLEVDQTISRLTEATGTAAKVAAVAKAQAATGTERGGSPVTPTPKEYDSFAAMRGDMEAWLTANT